MTRKILSPTARGEAEVFGEATVDQPADSVLSQGRSQIHQNLFSEAANGRLMPFVRGPRAWARWRRDAEDNM